MEKETMKRILPFAAILSVVVLTGCAETSQLQADVDALRAQVNTLSSQAAKADEANERSKTALETANRAEQTAEDTNSKLDRMFKKSMMK